MTQPEDWVTYDNIPTEDVRGVRVYIDTRGCNFTEVPHYVVTLESINGYHWFMTGPNSVYQPTTESFNVLARWVDHPSEDPFVGDKQYSNPLTLATARDLGLYVRWTAFQAAPDTTAEEEQVPEEPTTLAPRDPARDYLADELFQLSPNPASDYLTINPTEVFDRYELVSSTGAILDDFIQTTLTVSALPPGTYFIRAYRGNRYGLRRFVRQ
ncbi:hypothetical protein [Neolewinella sp.]|uniref:hypothetical protein n=1 Tax=Neolewinella sp. TaxID=2993543 RepID=UPI003B526E2C